jgi:hypothetical protein
VVIGRSPLSAFEELVENLVRMVQTSPRRHGAAAKQL